MIDAKKNEATLGDDMVAMGVRAKSASRAMAAVDTDTKNAALLGAAVKIRQNANEILAINAKDVADARARGQAASFIDRMALDDERVEGIARALEDIAALGDPVGKVITEWSRPNGLKIERIRMPIGVVAVIFESRPNVTVDAAAIAMKAGNVVILRGGSECIETSKALFACFHEALIEAGLPASAAQIVETTDRAAVGALLSGLDGSIDLVIPRGGKSLVARVQSEARAPVLSHLDGICHVYIDGDADPQKAVDITLNSKMRRTGVCGAAETLLIDAACLSNILPAITTALREAGCELRGDARVREADPSIARASEEDFHTEYLDAILSVAVVDGVDDAINHIETYGSGHTETIITENDDHAKKFIAGIGSAIVMQNASTQFADGGEFGLGAEIGIATGRLHARGPVGVEELTTYKNVVRGVGQIRP